MDLRVRPWRYVDADAIVDSFADLRNQGVADPDDPDVDFDGLDSDDS